METTTAAATIIQLGNTVFWNNGFFCSIFCQPVAWKTIYVSYIHTVSLIFWSLFVVYVIYLRSWCCVRQQRIRQLFQASSPNYIYLPMVECWPYVGLGSHLATTPTSICKCGSVLHSMGFQGWALICCPLCSTLHYYRKNESETLQGNKTENQSPPKEFAKWLTVIKRGIQEAGPGAVGEYICHAPFCLHRVFCIFFIHLPSQHLSVGYSLHVYTSS